jgi:hypothetical protein
MYMIKIYSKKYYFIQNFQIFQYFLDGRFSDILDLGVRK